MKYKHVNKINLVREKTNIPVVQIKKAANAIDFIREIYEGIDIYESVFILTLNQGNYIDNYFLLSKGGTAGSVIDTKIIAKFALDSLSASVILVHNHPSNNNLPSESDIVITIKVKEALNFFDITLLDHIIIGPSGYYSFNDQGKLI